MTTADGFIGLDLGTSSLKGAAIAADGTILAHARVPYLTRRPQRGRAEQNPRDWERAAVAVTRQLRRSWDGRVGALGLSGMIPTLVTLDRGLEPVGAAITWEDGRAEAEGEALRRRLGADTLYRSTGQWLDGRYLLPMYRWLETHQPDRARATSWIASAKDHLFHWLTGELATDPSTATGFGSFALEPRAWDVDLCQEMGVNPGAPAPGQPGLPQVWPCTGAAGLAAPAARRMGLTAGLPVILGGADSVMGAVGLGARRPGAIAHLAGTSTVILGLSSHPRFDPEHRWLVTPLAGPPGWGLEMDLMATGSAIAWLGSLLRLPDPPGAAVLALAGRATEDDVVFLPYLGYGEQGALWDPTLRGVLAGLGLATGPAEIARALLTGILVETRRCAELLRDGSGPARGPIHLGGWGSDDRGFRHQLADATQRRVLSLAPSADETVVAASGLASAIGAARVAAIAIGAPAAPAGRQRLLTTSPTLKREAVWAAIARRQDRWRARTHVRGPTGD
ncbi:MAG TPA: FGGY-family carbohydrate kinase [Verrucomicrobiae bacterium]|nr:FGGY-family carbohydrate kinase [Verrucomicrobiae bacterium]